MKKITQGFTLIELLVVIAIIALLATVGMASYRSANTRARDSRRQADLEQVRAALEMYRTDVGSYPGGSSTNDLCCGAGTPLLNYMSGPVKDPKSNTDYGYSSSGTGYELGAVFENASTTTCTLVGFTYCVRNP